MKENCILPNIISRQAEKYGERQALSYVNEKGDTLASYSYASLNNEVNECAVRLASLGLKSGDICLVFSANRPEMVIIDFACYALGAVPVSVYSTSSDDQVEFIVGNCHPVIAFAGDDNQFATLEAIQKKSSSLKQVYNWADGAAAFKAIVPTVTIEEVNELRKSVTPEQTATLIYTSGTTGEPKAADLPHSCFNTVVRIHKARLQMLSDKDTSLCFLPLCHIFEKAWTYFCISMGISVIINENAKEIGKTIAWVHPTCMCSVPRFWEKAYAVINEKMAKMPIHKRTVAKLALRVGRRRNLYYKRLGKKVPWYVEQPYRMLEKIVIGPVRRLMGVDKGNLFPTAGAPVSSEIVTFFRSMGVNMVVGYGLSETSATVSCYPDVDYVVGSVGTVMPELEVRIGLEGEIQVKGPTVMRGYYNNEKATQEAFTKDGWLRTGDAGYIGKEGGIVLTERIKDLFKTSNGKYIAPQAIESRLGTDRFIEQVAVVGESRSYITAIIIPAYEALKEYAHSKRIAFKSIDDLLHNSEIVKMIGDRIEKLQKGLPNFEKIKKFTLLPKAFTIESGELTNTLKIRRPIIAQRYAKEIEAMYSLS